MSWIFAQRLAGHSVARITRALNEAAIPCPSAADPDRNPHRTAAAWTLGTVTTVLGNPRYTGRQVWNRQRTDSKLADTSADPPDPARPKNAYIREDRILPHLPALHLLLTGTQPAPGRRRTRRGADARPQAGAEDVIGYVRDRGITLTYDPAAGTLQAGTCEAAKTLIRKAG